MCQFLVETSKGQGYGNRGCRRRTAADGGSGPTYFCIHWRMLGLLLRPLQSVRGWSGSVWCLCLSQYKLLSAERERSAKELDLLKEENVSTKAKNSELESENQALEHALRQLHEQSKPCNVAFISFCHSSFHDVDISYVLRRPCLVLPFLYVIPVMCVSALLASDHFNFLFRIADWKLLHYQKLDKLT